MTNCNKLYCSLNKDLGNILVILIFLFGSYKLFPQDNVPIKDSLIAKYSRYVELPREILYVHLNKTHYLTGETVGFTIYSIDKSSKKPLKDTRNIYCRITDEKGLIVKEKLLVMVNGISFDSFYVDELLPHGTYTITTYTNYQRNFKEPNSYSQHFFVVDPSTAPEYSQKVDDSIDLQVLAEGGHLLNGVNNSIGIIIKSEDGYGIPNLSGVIERSDGTILSTFTTNKFGIAKTWLFVNNGNKYYARVTYRGQNHSVLLPIADLQGVNFSFSHLKDKIAVSIKTNSKTFPTVKNEKFKLIFHDGSTIKAIHIQFEDSTEVIKFIGKSDLFPGINIFTFFDDQDNPLLERLIFNMEGLAIKNSGDARIKKEKDSTLEYLSVKLPIENFSQSDLHNISISVLPTETRANVQQQNILSKSFLSPYLKSPIENASYYFRDVTIAKEYELDMLLLTQGWSSYNWHDIFNNPPKILYPFENGIGVSATINGEVGHEYMVYASLANSMEIIDPKDQNKFTLDGLFPFENELISISELNKKGKLKKPSLYLQFFPSKFLDFKHNQPIMKPKSEELVIDYNFSQIVETSWTEIEQLDEVTLTVNLETRRKRDLENDNLMGKVDVFNEQTRNRFMDLASYLRTKGYQVVNEMGTFQIFGRRGPNSFNNNRPPQIYIDDMPLMNNELLYSITMANIDYIVFNDSGLGGSQLDYGGSIKIYTDPKVPFNYSSPTVLSQEYPLTFSRPNKFYAPKYTFYTNSFFKEYGVIEWLPLLKANKRGMVEFRIEDHDYKSFKLFIEGVSENGSFISEEKTIVIN
ncbi:hypothetical protein [Aegicerativicinus sediminis]|uniref:hypothetical protein n=1 Tax=Aegicerativicinus sediminis TaxID=2893202 RepID=UPI001E3A4284|nr:hypothetical protein [Aegicerativicinus sediminis]